MQPITRITYRSGAWMDRIQVSYGNVSAPAHGGDGGDPGPPVHLAANEHIVGADVGTSSFGGFVASFTFVTSANRTLRIGNLAVASDQPATPCPPPGDEPYVLQAFSGTLGTLQGFGQSAWLRTATLLWGVRPNGEQFSPAGFLAIQEHRT